MVAQQLNLCSAGVFKIKHRVLDWGDYGEGGAEFPPPALLLLPTPNNLLSAAIFLPAGVTCGSGGPLGEIWLQRTCFRGESMGERIPFTFSVPASYLFKYLP